MHAISLVAGIVTALILGVLGRSLGRRLRSNALGVGALVVAAVLGFAVYRDVAPWAVLTVASRTPGNPLYAIAQKNQDTADVIQLELYNAYLKGGEPAMRAKAQELGLEYISANNVFLAIAEGDEGTLDDALRLFRLILARGEASAPEKCGAFLGHRGGVTIADLGLSAAELAQANLLITQILSRTPAPKTPPEDVPGPLRDFLARRHMGEMGFQVLTRDPASLTPEENAEKCRAANRVLEGVDELPPAARVAVVRGFFAALAVKSQIGR